MSFPSIRRQAGTRPLPESDHLVLPALFESQVASTPDRIALTTGDEQLTYSELNARANQVAHRLRSIGARPEALVGISVERTAETVIGILGILKSGAAYLPVDPAMPDERRKFILSDSQINFFLDQEQSHIDSNGSMNVLSLNRDWNAEFGQQKRSNPKTLAQPHNLAYVIYTSGSTGRPKGVQVEHRQVDRLFTATRGSFGFCEKDVWTLFHSCSFDFSVWELWGSLLYGGRLVVVPRETVQSTDRFHDLLLREQVTVLNQTPSAFWQLMRVDERRPEPKLGRSLRFVIFGGEALEVQRLRPWIERYGHDRPNLINMYGITETTVHCTLRRIRSDDLSSDWSPIGEPIPDLQIQLLDDKGDPVTDGDVGEIYVAGAGVTRGYLNRPKLTAQRFLEHPFRAGDRVYRSGDLAKCLPNGELDFVGRADNQIKLRGFRVELGEIESQLDAHPAIHQSAVALREVGAERRKQLVAYVVLRSAPRPTIRELRSYLKTKLPEYMLPATFVELQAFPLTINSKLDRSALPSPETCDSLDAEGPLRVFNARSAMENLISEIWSKVLAKKQVSVDITFVEQGGDSLSLMDLSVELEKELNRPFPIHTLVQAPTIEAQAKLADADPQLLEWTPLVPLKTSGSKPPFFCVHPGGGNALCYQGIADCFDEDRPFVAIQAYGVDGRQPHLGTIEEMAAAYVKAIKLAQPHGPYFLGGWSFGGLVAFEMARLLESEGSRVETLAIIDAGIRYSLAVVRTLFLHDNVPLFHMSSLDQAELLPHFREPSIQAQLVPPQANDELVAHILKVFVGNCDAVFRFRPKSFPGRAVLFTASEKLVEIRVRRAPYREWSELCLGGVQQVLVPGNHLTMINPPHAATLAAGLAAVCDGQSPPCRVNPYASKLIPSSRSESFKGR